MQAKGETFMLNQFQAYLVQRGYREFSINGNPAITNRVMTIMCADEY